MLAAALLLVAGCVQRADSYARPVPPPAQTAPQKATQAATINLEAADRIARFRRLAGAIGTTPPHVDELFAPAGSVPGVEAPVPVVRVVFEEAAFFDSGRATRRAASDQIIEMVAASMKHDVPDAALTVLGHTDAVGSDSYNLDLSQRRAASVLGELIAKGLNPNQLSTVAIGKEQPIAANRSEEGRARNRRVEFLISGSEQANMSVIRDRVVDAGYLRLAVGDKAPSHAARTVEVLKPSPAAAAGEGEVLLSPAGLLTLRAPAPTGREAEAAERR